MLGRIRFCITWHSVKIIYTSMIRPIIEYCDTVQGYCGQVNKNASESLQRQAGRIVCRASSSEDAIKKLNLTTLAYGQSKHTLNLGNKCIKGQCPQFLKNYFTLNKHLDSCDTHQKTLIHLPSVRTEIAKQSFYYYGSIVYNSSKQSNFYIHNFKFRNLKPYKCVLYLRVSISHEILTYFIQFILRAPIDSRWLFRASDGATLRFIFIFK